MDWNIKTDQEGAPVVNGNKVTFVNPDGEDVELDPPSMYTKILGLNKESQKHRELAQSLQTKFAIFKDIEDIERWHADATAALETVANFNDKDYIKADKVEEFKRQINDDWKAKLDQKDTQIKSIHDAHALALSGKDARIRKLMVSNQFAQSSWFVGDKKKTTLGPDIAESFWGEHFRVEEAGEDDLKLVAYYDRAGKDAILSKHNPGEPATFEEAVGLLIDRYPRKNEILVSGDGGSGGGGGQGGAGTGDEISDLKRQIKAAQEEGGPDAAKKMIVLKNRLFQLQKAQGK